MKRAYWYVIATYVIMQYSVFAAIPILKPLFNLSTQNELENAIYYWQIFSFLLGLGIVLYLMRSDMREPRHEEAASNGKVFLWSFLGLFLVWFGSLVATLIESGLGINQVSENTQGILDIIRMVPFFMLIPMIVAPILEEIIFRKIIFGVLNNRIGFFFSALISSLVFALVHGEPLHLLKYAAMGFALSYVYVKTKRLIAPIIVHMALNSFVVILQLVFADLIEDQLDNLETLKTIFIGG